MPNIKIDVETADPLRTLAARLGYRIARGVGAGEVGNIAGLLKEVARRYEEAPDAVFAAFSELDTEYSAAAEAAN